MGQALNRQHIAVRASVLLATIVVALGIGAAGIAKFAAAGRWHHLFESWGYPAWFSPLVGAVEIICAAGLFVPRVARMSAAILSAVMASALATLLLHRGGELGWGLTPLVYLLLLAWILAMRTSGRPPLVTPLKRAEAR